MNKNHAKHLSYTEGWRRIKLAYEHEHYFEVVTLCESMISDRLLSYVKGVEPNSTVDVHTSFGKLISMSRKTGNGMLSDRDGRDLGAEVDLWRGARNTVVHELMKSAPGTPTADVSSFIERARKCAGDGMVLARAVSNWHRTQLRGVQVKKKAR